MPGTTSIEWTQVTWNPVTGCSKVSQGCKHCYAERMALRLRAMGAARYRDGFAPRIHEDLVTVPLHWRRPSTIFVNSMSDLFHEDVPATFIRRVFDTMAQAHWHTFQVLTKRSARLAGMGPDLPWPSNIWMGVSVEDEHVLDRVADLKRTPAAVRFLSCEPLLGPLASLPLAGIHWVIVGGESGPGARPMRHEWVDGIRRQCEQARIPFFFKQWGGVHKRKAGRSLDGRTYDEMPEAISEPGKLASRSG